MILEKNYRSPFGEIDIIAKINDEVVFVEVKASRSTSFGYPEARVDKKKLARIRKTAIHYINNKLTIQSRFRFDLISLLKTGPDIEIEHFKDIDIDT